MNVQWWRCLIGVGAFIIVGLHGVWTWAQSGEPGMPVGYGVMSEGIPPGGRRVLSEENPI